MNAKLIFAPRITITAERAAIVLGISIERANRILSQPDAKDIILRALEHSFQETVDAVLKNMARVPAEAVPSPRVDCSVEISGVSMMPGIGM